jgi:hydrogenase maturation factor
MAGGREISRSIFILEEFGDLNGIQGGAFEQLVAANPEGDAIFHSTIAAETTGEAIVLSGTIERHGISILHKLEARRILKSCAGVLERDGF